jgi:hypothetical protein
MEFIISEMGLLMYKKSDNLLKSEKMGSEKREGVSHAPTTKA